MPTIGGTGGKIYKISNLDDSGPGSLREACEATGPRIADIQISGEIKLKTPIVIKNPFLTITTDNLPGGKVMLSGFPVYIAFGCHDILFKHNNTDTLANLPIDGIRGFKVSGDIATTYNIAFEGPAAVVPPPTPPPPTGDKTAPVLGALIVTRYSNMLTVSTSASDNIGVTKAELFINGVVVDTLSVLLPKTFQLRWLPRSIPVGTYACKAVVTDLAGNKTEKSASYIRKS